MLVFYQQKCFLLDNTRTGGDGTTRGLPEVGSFNQDLRLVSALQTDQSNDNIIDDKNVNLLTLHLRISSVINHIMRSFLICQILVTFTWRYKLKDIIE